MAGGPGFEPGLTGSEPVVLPLNYLPKKVTKMIITKLWIKQGIFYIELM